MNKLLAIFIPTYERPFHLKRLLISLEKQVKKYKVAVYINDDSCNKDSRQIVDNFDYRHLIYNKSKRDPEYPSKNLIDFLKHSRAKFSWIIGDDEIVLEGSIERLLKMIKLKPKLELIWVNAFLDKERKEKYLNAKIDLFYDNCINFFSDFHYKTHTSTTIVRTRPFLNANLKKYLKAMHVIQGGLWEYLAKYYKKKGKNNIFAITRPMVQFGKAKTHWVPYFVRIKYYGRLEWLNRLPKIYQKVTNQLYKEIFQERSKLKTLLEDKSKGYLKPNLVKQWFIHFALSVRLKAKLVSYLSPNTAKFMISFLSFINKLVKL